MDNGSVTETEKTRKFGEKYYINYFVFFVLLCAVTAYFALAVISAPRPYNILWFLCCGTMAYRLFRYSHRDSYVSPYDYEKQVRAFKKRKKAAKKAGEGFDETAPRRPEKMPSYISAYVLVLGFALFAVLLFSWPLCLIFPYHAPYEYKTERPTMNTEIFPEVIPKGACGVRWVRVPSFLQATGGDLLVFKADKEYIDGIVSEYADKAEYVRDGTFGWLAGFGWSENTKIYTLSDNHDLNHLWKEGFFVDEEHNKIGFFRGAIWG